MSFTNLDASRRTNESFRAREHQGHHKEKSPLEELDIDMVVSFPSSDSLHLLELGIMKRCMLRWTFGEKGYARKWSNGKIDSASRLLEECQKYMPTDIHRSIRNLYCLRKWKGLEFRTVLLYVGMIVFEQVLEADEYNHFMILCCVVRICSTNIYKNYLPIAGKMFKCYVEKYSKLYGESTIGSNVHLLTHIIEDMEQNNVGSLIQLSTYKYENCLRLLGLKLKHGNLPLEQVSRRLIEMSQLKNSRESDSLFNKEKFSPQVFYPNQHGTKTTYQRIQITPGIVLTGKKQRSRTSRMAPVIDKKSTDSWSLTKTGEIVRMEYAKVENNVYKIVGTSIKEKSALFTTPINSTKLKIFVSDGNTDNELHTYDIDSIALKFMYLPTRDKFAFIPIVHTMDSLQSI